MNHGLLIRLRRSNAVVFGGKDEKKIKDKDAQYCKVL